MKTERKPFIVKVKFLKNSIGKTLNFDDKINCNSANSEVNAIRDEFQYG